MVKLPEPLALQLDLPEELPHLEQALTHPSHANEHRSAPMQRGGAPGLWTPPDYQRLEFLGDAVLGMCVARMLFERYPKAKEGEMSLMRASLVNTEALADFARRVDLGASLRMGRGADAAGERQQSSVLADAVEALVGAVFLDLGLDRARALSGLIVERAMTTFDQHSRPARDPKSELQERVQAGGRPSPRYRVAEVRGPDHNREFVVVCEIEGRAAGQGGGKSKKVAEQAAAQDAIATLDLEVKAKQEKES